MISELDMDSMIIALTDGIGPLFVGTVRSSYYELASRLKKEPVFTGLNASTQQFVVDILALSTFYHDVISPLESGSSLLSLARKANATHVRIARDRLTPQFVDRLRKCKDSFHAMLSSNRIPVDVLSFPTLKMFIAKVQDAQKRAEHEAVD